MGRDTFVMVVDDDPSICLVVEETLKEEGHRTLVANSAEDALVAMDKELPDLLLADWKMPGMNGIDLLEKARHRDNNMALLLMSGQATVQCAVKAMKLGADAVVEKPFDVDLLKAEVARSVGRQAMRRELARRRAEKELQCTNARSFIVGRSKAIRGVFETIDSISSSAKATVLIQGESGTGKELVAKAIHLSSPRCDQKFMEVNCAALAETLLDAELFGYEKGAFTGASPGGRIGLFEAADGGTLFLDEIGEMSVSLQAKLLRVLQEKRFKRVGGVEDISVDVRVIASSNRDLTEEVEKGNFRSDLYYRLQVIPLRIPPLRERKEDIPLLAEHFLCEFNAEMGKEICGIARDAMDLLQTHDWPGNVRELRNVMERAAILERGEKVLVGSVLIGPDQRAAKRGIQLELDDCNVANMERRLIEKVLDDMMWRRSAAARALGISRATLYNKIKQYELEPKAP